MRGGRTDAAATAVATAVARPTMSAIYSLDVMNVLLGRIQVNLCGVRAQIVCDMSRSLRTSIT